MVQLKRAAGRDADTLRPTRLDLDFIPYPAGSVLIAFGNTRVLCSASVERGVPRWLRDQGLGWVTAEYSMLPASTHTRGRRERNKVGGRTQEIQRLIGRSLRAAVDRRRIGERTILIDCDVLQADGGTRTASITGGFIALALACGRLMRQGLIEESPIVRAVSAISCGIVDGRPLLDLDYVEDSSAEVDLNLVMDHQGGIIEIQGTGEGGVMRRDQLDALVDLGTKGCQELAKVQLDALKGFPELELGQ